MALLQKKAMTIDVAFFGDFAAKKVTTTMSSPFSMVMLL
jgi:hypothetical protein